MLSREQIEKMRSYDPNFEGPLTPTGLAIWQAICDQAASLLDRPPERGVADFAEKILHGDANHRKWLMDAAAAYVLGEPIKPPKPTADAGWIPVSEKLPENEVRVLVHTDNSDGMAVADRVLYKDGTPGGYWHGHYGVRFKLEEITHWMPLPPAPLKEPGK